MNNNYFNWKNSSNNFNNIYTSWSYKKINKNNSRYSAGILPYTFDQTGKLLFLLGRDNDSDWSDFGGRCEFRDNNVPKNTASREFYEETLGAVLTIQECIDKMIETKKVESKTLNGSPYHMYFVYIDFINYSDTFNKTANFLKYQFEQRTVSRLIEKVNIRWVSIDTLLNCIDNRDDSKPISLRGVFYKTITQFRDKLISLER
jgi:hypothetical protein